MRKPRFGVTAATALMVTVVVTSPLVAQPAALTEDEQRDFLLKAPIVGSRPIGKGVTGSLRLTLSDGRVSHDAAFQTIDDRTSMEDRARGRKRAGELNFADSYKYNIAAYQLARLLGLSSMMPVTVERTVKGQTGSLTWWVDNVLMDEAEREKTNTTPPSPLEFQRKRQRMMVFAELIRDVDRNKGNIIYTKDWNVIMIDFTRAFRLERELRLPNVLQQIDRGLFERLKAVTDAEIRRAATPYLTDPEISGVTARRKLVIERVERLIRERGESAVLY